MPKRKRSNQEKMDRYERKLRKLQCVQSFTAESSDNYKSRVLDEEFSEQIGSQYDPPPPPDIFLADSPLSDHADGVAAVAGTVSKSNVSIDPKASVAHLNTVLATTQEPLLSNLDTEMLSALGEATEDCSKFGDKIHHNLAQRWLPLLRKGLFKETKEKLLKDYLIPENCTLLQAPKLNVEIAAAITEMAKNRDKKMETDQQQLGVGIAAINKALTILLTRDDKITVIKYLCDACRILSDLHFCETQSRLKLITPGLAKSFLNIIQDSERDETLYGNKLSDKIKTSKAIEKQGLQIKKLIIGTKNTPVPGSSTSTIFNYPYQGNWMGPPRYPLNRGGRGGSRKTATGARKAPSQPQLQPTGQNKL